LSYSYASALRNSSPDTGSDGNVTQEDDFFCFGTCGADKRGANAEVDMYLTDISNVRRTLAIFQLLADLFTKVQ
jgi:hypothetical protein